ncbi:hypothetical protein FNV43_RR06937 [Rhamnella rubrinervis]|uniref:Uncharacterized protein n=1 Tax=Rhamnella rubrinervis TaxID=2594499 RepID=A0A8K0MM88_9ROSA|nr:hypothetical protein FNV43_RR06937 [Rhamnella rubrinervis]
MESASSKNLMEGVGKMTVSAQDEGEVAVADLNLFPDSSSSTSSSASHSHPVINAKVYRRRDGCIGLADKFDKYANYTTTCCCTFGCARSTLSPKSATGMDEVEGHIAGCYNSC